MKKRSRLRTFLFSPWMLAVIPAVLLMLTVKPDMRKIIIMLDDKEDGCRNILSEDLNSDGATELMLQGKGIPWYFVLVTDNKTRVYDQWNFTDMVDPDMCKLFTGNFDNDTYRELYMFTYRGDSLFLNVNEFLEPGGFRLERKYIMRISFINDKVTTIIYPAGFHDVNGDGKNELYFTVYTGFGVEPRLACYYDLGNDLLKVAPGTGVSLHYPSLFDVDGDSKPELFGSISAAGNQKKSYPMSDYSSWFLVYNDSLEPKFPPLEIPGLTNSIITKGYRNGGFSGYFVTYYTGSADTGILESRVMVFSATGRRIRERLNTEMGLGSYQARIHLFGSGNIVLYSDNIIETDTLLNVIGKCELAYSYPFTTYFFDINNDDNEEMILYHHKDKKMVVYDQSLKYLAETELNATGHLVSFSKLVSPGEETVNILETGLNCYAISLRRNNLGFLGYLAYPGIYLALVLFIMLIRRITFDQVMKNQELRKRLVTLQLQSVRAQLDPHFTFNTLNSVAALIYLQDRQTAYEYMNKFTRLLRSMIDDSERIYRKIGEELEFVTTYLELEKLRFGEKFNYTIKVAEDVSMNEEVPKLVLHTYVENAVKHGLMPRTDGGILKVSIGKKDNYLWISVEDNGIGREKSDGQSTSTGKGLKLTAEFYEILNSINTKPIRHQITDLYDPTGEPSGTRAEVWVPAGETYF